MLEQPSSPTARLSEIYNKYNSPTDFTSPSRQRQASPTPLPTGPLVKSGLGVGANYLIAEYITAHGDTFVHHSCPAIECLPDNLYIRRVIVLTENALYKVPQTATETGLFFNARVPLRDITQAIVSDKSSSRFEVDFIGMRFGSPSQNLFTLNFGAEFEVRREFLIVLGTVHPTVNILHKQTTAEARSPPRSNMAATLSAVPSNPSPRSPGGRRTPKFSGGGSSRSPPPYDASFISSSAGGGLRDLEPDIVALRGLLHDNGSVELREIPNVVRPSTSADRTLNEANDEDDERRRVRSMLDQMEQRIQQRVVLETQKAQARQQRKSASPSRPSPRDAPSGTTLYAKRPPPTPPPPPPVKVPDKVALGRAFPLFHRWRQTGGLLARSDAWTRTDSEKLVHALSKVLEAYEGKSVGPAVHRVIAVLGMVQREMQFIGANVAPDPPQSKQASKPSTSIRPFRLTSKSPIRFKDMNASVESFAATVQREGDEHRNEMHRIRTQFAQRQNV